MKINRFLNVLLCICCLSIMACSEPDRESGRGPVARATAVLPEEELTAGSGEGTVSNIVPMDVYKSPTCACCGKWLEHAEQRGFSLTSHHPADLNQLKVDQGLSQKYQSCHTAVSEQGYVFEGHIPARYIRQFLANTPADALGLAVPGMPAGSPGMEMGGRFTSYQVLLLKRDGSAEVFAEVNTPAQQYQ